jgi:hypothetical protein
MLDVVVIGFIVLTILLFIFGFGGYWRPRNVIIREALLEHPNVDKALRELREHPRIAKAIRELEDAIAYMEAAPHDFGGHKFAAIQHARAAIEQLRRAIVYRALR